MTSPSLARSRPPDLDPPLDDVVGHPLDHPHTIRQAALRSAVRHLGADAGCYNMLVRGADRVVRLHGVASADAFPAAAALWRCVEGAAIVMADGDLDHTAPLNELGPPPEDYYRSAVWRTLFERMGYRRVTFMNVGAGISMRGHVQLFRASSEPWALPDALRDDVAAALCGAFREAWEVETALAPPDGSVTVRTDDTLAATEALATWIERHDAGPWLRARAHPVTPEPTDTFGSGGVIWAPGSFLRAQAIPGGGALLTFSAVTALDLPPVFFRLTTIQRRVASLAAAGATAIEIAKELERSPETVREHLSRIYARLGVASRSELATLCRRMMV